MPETIGREIEPQYLSPLVKKLYETIPSVKKHMLDSNLDMVITNMVWDMCEDEEREKLPEDFFDGGDGLWQWLDEMVKKVGHPPKALENIYEGVKKTLDYMSSNGIAIQLGDFGKGGWEPKEYNISELSPMFKHQLIRTTKNGLEVINRLAKIIGKPELELPDILRAEVIKTLEDEEETRKIIRRS